jgi:putative ABC transport system substrate-binding protein
MILKSKICIEFGRSIRKRECVRIAAILAAVVMCAAGVNAQQPQKIPRIGYLSSLDRVNDAARTEPFRQALRDLGYIEGQTIVIEYRYRQGKSDQYAEFAAEFMRLKVDLIVVAGGAPVVHAIKNTAKTTPIIMLGGGADPVKAGLVESLARPGGNVTGDVRVRHQSEDGKADRPNDPAGGARPSE